GVVAAAVLVSLAIIGAGLTEIPIVHGQSLQAGSVTGRVRITARVRGSALSANTYPSRTVTVQAPPRIPELRSVVIYLKDVVYRGTPPAVRRQIRQEHESFVPRVVAITRGSTVDFPNGDAY